MAIFVNIFQKTRPGKSLPLLNTGVPCFDVLLNQKSC